MNRNIKSMFILVISIGVIVLVAVFSSIDNKKADEATKTSDTKTNVEIINEHQLKLTTDYDEADKISMFVVKADEIDEKCQYQRIESGEYVIELSTIPAKPTEKIIVDGFDSEGEMLFEFEGFLKE